MARRITKEEGIFVGYSAGSAIAGLMQMKDKLKPDDIVVVIFHDHGSRYVGKLYNDEWMRERQFLDAENKTLTARKILERKKETNFLTVTQDQPLKEATQLMRELGISQLPVVKDDEMVGSISEHRLLSSLLENPEDATKTVGELMAAPFPFVEMDASSKEISSLINKDNSAVLVKDLAGQTNIITEYDLIQAIAG